MIGLDLTTRVCVAFTVLSKKVYGYKVLTVPHGHIVGAMSAA